MEGEDSIYSSASKEDIDSEEHLPQIYDHSIRLRVNPERRREKVSIGCGAGFGGDRPLAAVKLLQKVKELNYIILECLAERTLADHYKARKADGKGYDPRISEWMNLLLPLAVERGVCIITNMGASDPLGARDEILELARRFDISITVGVAHEFDSARAGSQLDCHMKDDIVLNQLREDDGDGSIYMGAAPIVECLERYKPNVIITSRVADAALFLAPMVYELGWNWNELQLLAQGTLAGHLLECGCQLTGGYIMHPGDKHRDISFQNLLDLSLPFAEVSFDGQVCVAKADGSGGLLNFHTCAEQLLYEIGDPAAYITPDIIVDFQDVSFQPLSEHKVLCSGAKPSSSVSVPDKLLRLAPKDRGWKGWGEISYGGFDCVRRAQAAEFLVRSWMEETYPGVNSCLTSYIIGLDSLKTSSFQNIDSVQNTSNDIRLRMDGLFEKEEQAIQFTKEFIALYTNGPAGGGGISTGHKNEITLATELIGRDHVKWCVGAWRSNKEMNSNDQMTVQKDVTESGSEYEPISLEHSSPEIEVSPAPSGQRILLYNVAHSRAGDKGNDSNFSIIPYFSKDVERLKAIITPEWVKEAVSPLLNPSSFPDSADIETRNKWMDEHVTVEIYEARGIHALNVVVRNILDGGVNCSRRIDRHGKTISDLILSQQVVLPP